MISDVFIACQVILERHTTSKQIFQNTMLLKKNYILHHMTI